LRTLARRLQRIGISASIGFSVSVKIKHRRQFCEVQRTSASLHRVLYREQQRTAIAPHASAHSNRATRVGAHQR
jgi:hypothetical protein